MTIEIREVRQDEIDILQKISRQTFTETFEDSNDPDLLEDFLNQAYDKGKLLNEMAEAKSQFYFCLEKENVLGYLKVNWEEAQAEDFPDNYFEVERIYFLKSFQGKGYGHRLLSFAEDIAKSLKKEVVWLGVWEHNEQAKAFYYQHGFRQFSEHAFYVGTDKQTDILLKKSL